MTSPTPPLPRSTILTPATATLVVIAACVSFGMVPLFAKLLLESGMSPAAIGFFRYAFSGIVMLPFLPLAEAKRREAMRLIMAGVLMGLGWISYLNALETVSVAAAGLVYMTYPVFALLLAWLLVRQIPSGRAWGGCALVLVAALIVFDGDLTGTASWSLLLSLPAPALFALIIVVLTCLTPSLSSLEKLACGMVGSMIGLAPVVAMTDPAAFLPRDGNVWLTILAMGFATALIPQLLYTVAAPKIGPGRTAAAGAVELPTMIALGWIVFGEVVGPREIIASILVLAAILLVPPITGPRTVPA
ncbi:MAG: DMT family transporter [Alphaproteobacteria bacterium]|nr:DMT family transporter [Alphaproteobacteria bacterium]